MAVTYHAVGVCKTTWHKGFLKMIYFIQDPTKVNFNVIVSKNVFISIPLVKNDIICGDEVIFSKYLCRYMYYCMYFVDAFDMVQTSKRKYYTHTHLSTWHPRENVGILQK